MTSALRVQWIVDGVEGSETEGWKSSLASNRYRVLAPREVLIGKDHTVTLLDASTWSAHLQTIDRADVVVVGKIAPGGDAATVKQLSGHVLAQLNIAREHGVRVVADFNDDHFDRPLVGSYWRSLARCVDLCVVGSDAMAARMQAMTSAPLRVIPDPVLSATAAPRIFAAGGWKDALQSSLFKRQSARLRLLWFGNLNNWPMVLPWAESLVPLARSQPWQLDVVTQPHPSVLSDVERFNQRYGDQAVLRLTEWSDAVQNELLSSAHVVLLPSNVDDGTKSVKTANRLTDALNAGCYVVASPLPSYVPFATWCALTESPLLELRSYLRDPKAALDRVRAGQGALEALVGKLTIGSRWADALADVSAAPAVEQLGVSAPPVAPIRIAVLMPRGCIPWQVRFESAFADDVAVGRVVLDIVSEEDIAQVARTPKGTPDSQAWLLGRFSDFAPTLLLFVRYAGPHAEEILAWARQHGVASRYHLDDDLLALPDYFALEKLRFHRHPRRVESMRYLLEHVDAVHCVSRELAARLRDVHGVDNQVVVSQSIGIGRRRREASTGSVRLVGYMGTRDHNLDLAEVAPAIAEVMHVRPEVHFALMGELELPECLTPFADRVERYPGTGSYTEFLKNFDSLDWDIGLCPGGSDPFSRSKTPIKWIDYTSIGAAVVASRGSVFDELCADGRGLLASSTQEWTAALVRLIDDADLRRGMVARAQAYMMSRYSKTAVRADLFEALGLDDARAPGADEPIRPLVKLNLGCGDKILPGYVNVDVVAARNGRAPDVLCDLRDLSVFEDDYADEILSVHVVEHFWRWEVVTILKEWLRVLRPGGRMVIECPNLRSACEALLAEGMAAGGPGPEGQRSMWVFYGDPRWQDPLMVHRWGYTPESLRALLEEIGLTDVAQEPAQYKLREPRDMRVVGRKPLG